MRRWFVGLAVAVAGAAWGQGANGNVAPPASAAEWAVDAGGAIDAITGVTYLRASGQELKLDVYAPRGLTRPNPTVIAFHGGGWVAGNKDGLILHLLPYLELGWSVVNVQYRLASVAPAPAAVEDCRCALRFVLEHADEYHFDTGRIVVTGASAGGHLALTTALLPVSAGFDRPCPLQGAERWGAAAPRDVKVAAVVNWFGITDVADLVEGANARGYALEWLGSRGDRLDLARRLSPLTYVRPGAPPVLTIHGDQDTIVPYAHATRLHAALDQAGASNRLLTVAGAGHGDFSAADRRRAFAAIREFLATLGLLSTRP